MTPRISFCIVNTNARELVLECLGSIFEHPPATEFEVIVLDNASADGSASAIRERYGERVQLIERERRISKAANDSELIGQSSGEYSLLLNADSRLTAGAADALLSELESRPRAAAAGAQLVDGKGSSSPSAWRFPGLGTALAGIFFLHRRFTVQSSGAQTKEVDWVQSAGMLVRRSAFEQVGPLDPRFFVYSEEVDWQRRAKDLGWSILYVPAARIVHEEQLSSDPSAVRRIVEFSRNRDLYVTKHHGPAVALAVRVLTSATYLLRAVAALVLPRHSARRYLRHAYHSLFPGAGDGLREAAEAYNRTLDERDGGGRGSEIAHRLPDVQDR